MARLAIMALVHPHVGTFPSAGPPRQLNHATDGRKPRPLFEADSYWLARIILRRAVAVRSPRCCGATRATRSAPMCGGHHVAKQPERRKGGKCSLVTCYER
jgi:hypothetical protein